MMPRHRPQTARPAAEPVSESPGLRRAPFSAPVSRLGVCVSTLVLLAGMVTCRQSYDPPAIAAPNAYLVVDGFINTDPLSVTTFNLNRTRRLNDSTTIGVPELHASCSIVGKHGDVYPLTDTAGTGVYSSGPLSLDVTQQYSIAITTRDGRKYSSDAVACKQSPPMDSLFWSQPGDLTIYASTHDPTGNARYYRYDYTETWQHNANLIGAWILRGDTIVPADSTNETWYCWSSALSTNVLITTSVALGQDIITSFPVNVIPRGDARVAVGYSILVRQYAMTEEAYNYWNLIEKTSQNVGTLFDLQPTQLVSNIHCTTNPSEAVIGYLSASSVREQRLFIANSSLSDWVDPVSPAGCEQTLIPYNFNQYPILPVTDTSLGPYYFITGGMYIAPKTCLDCQYQGGTRTKPPFWPQ